MYSTEWAKSRFELLYKEHPRASYFLLVQTSLTPKTVWMWLAKSHTSIQSRDYWMLWKALLRKLEELCPELRKGSTIQMYSKQARSALHDIFMEIESNLPRATWTAAEHWRNNEKSLLRAGLRPAGQIPNQPKADGLQFVF